MLVYQVACCQQQLSLTRKCPQALFMLLPKSTCQSCAGSLPQKLAIVSFSLMRCEFSRGMPQVVRLLFQRVIWAGSLPSHRVWTHCYGGVTCETRGHRKWIFKGSVANWQLQRGQSPQKRGNSFNKNSNLKSNEQVCLLSDSTLKKWLLMSKDTPAVCNPEPEEQAISTGIQNLLMAKVSLRTYESEVRLKVNIEIEELQQ